MQSSGWKEPQPELRQPVLSRSRLASLGQPLARTSRVEWGRGGLYFTVRDWRRGQWRATSPITAAASSLAVMLNTESWLHLDKVHVSLYKVKVGNDLETSARIVAVSANASPSRVREGHREGSLWETN